MGCAFKQLLKLLANGQFKQGGCGADELRAVKARTQANDVGCTGQSHFELRTDGVDLSFDGVARDSAFGPPLGHHGAQPNTLRMKERGLDFGRDFRQSGCLAGRQAETVQGEMRRARNRAAGEGGLELGTGF